ncbi:MAG: hypothetical protein JRH19_23605 [Deltaproteobacteria bacterium]|nr:hypothetical protein [Deltaproteobacteria bacterium]
MRERFRLPAVLVASLSGLLAGNALAVTVSAVAVEQPSGAGDHVEVHLFVEIPRGEKVAGAFWSIRCTGCTLTNFMFEEAGEVGSGQVQWTATDAFAPFAAGGPQWQLNTSGSFAHVGDGQGTILFPRPSTSPPLDSTLGVIAADFQPGIPVLASGTGAYKVGTITVRMDAAYAVLSPFAAHREGAFGPRMSTVAVTFVDAELSAAMPAP